MLEKIKGNSDTILKIGETMKYWAKCYRCGKEFTHDEWHKEMEMICDGWTWEEKHSDEYCKKHRLEQLALLEKMKTQTGRFNL